MPNIPGVQAPAKAARNGVKGIDPRAVWGVGIALALALGFFGVRALVQPKPADSEPAEPAPQTSVATPAVAAVPRPPNVSETHPEVATLKELEAPWSSKEFYFRSPSASAYVPALIVRLPGAAGQSNSYWAFSLEVPFSQCRYEYIANLAKLSSDYGFQAKHPMVANPCSRTVFDPSQLNEMPGAIMVRGAIVQGWDTRPPYGIEVRVSGNQIRALRIE